MLVLVCAVPIRSLFPPNFPRSHFSFWSRALGLIINISSIAGRHVTALAGAAYCSSKFGVSALGDAVGVECHEDNIRVTNIMPGECVSEILDKRPNPCGNFDIIL